MKNVAFIAVVLCSLLIGCPMGDTDPPGMWRQTVPRLTGRTDAVPCEETLREGRVVAESQCGIHKNAFACVPSQIEEDPARELVARPQCVDDVIEEFRRRAVLEPEAWADVAAAYYVRAQIDDRASDLLEAFDAARRAVLRVPASRVAHFNLALAQQQLAMRDDAARSWQTVIRLEPESSAWRAFAQRRVAALQVPDRVFRKDLMEAAVASGDAAAVARLMTEMPYSAVHYFENTLLPRWSAARSPKAFAEARLYATALSRRLNGDRFSIDVVESLVHSTKPDLLRRGFAAYAAERYDEAVPLLEQAQSPFALRARQSSLAARTVFGSTPEQLQAADALLVRARGYVHLTGELHSLRALVLWGGSGSAEAIEAYTRAEETYIKAGDGEKQCEAISRRSGNWRLVGKYETSMREVLRAARCAPGVDPQERSVTFGEAAKTAQSLGRPVAALAYMHTAVDAASGLHKAVALRERAAVHLELGQFAAAEKDLDTAIRTDKEIEEMWASSFQARLLELRAYLTDNRELLTQAIEASRDQNSTFTALLYTKRAAKREGAEAEEDLRRALEIIRNEEKAILDRRETGEFENLWSAYFNRFRETYDELVQRRMEAADAGEAFAVSERMRAFDLLDLIQKRQDVPAEFRRLLAQDRVAPADIQKHLPEGTVLASYMNLDDRTYVWILSRTRFEPLRLKAGRREIERWKAAILRRVGNPSSESFSAATHAPYEELLAPVLKAAGPAKRFVLIPDEPMQGLPYPAMRGDTTPWLVQQVLLEVAPSATLYVYSLLQDRALARPGPLSVLLIGNPTFAASTKEDPLPNSETEVAAIERDYGKTATVLRLVRDQPTVERFLQEAPQFQVVHVATHTVVDKVRPEVSEILLAHGNIGIRDLLRKLQLHQTRLFVLASCKSVGGIPVGPEGVAPLVRPLLAAGVPAVVGSLWNVKDDTAEQFAVSFHRHYRNSSDAAAAVRATQLQLIREGQAVAAWAPFLMIGHHSAPAANEWTMKGKTLNDQFHSQDSLQRSDGLRAQ